MKCFRLILDNLAWIKHQFLSGIRDSRKTGSLWGMMRDVGGGRKSIHHSWLTKGLWLLCWGFKGVYEEIPSEETSTLQIGSVSFPPEECTSPQLHPYHRLFDQDGNQAQRLSLWDNWGDERGCDEGHWHAHTRGFTWSLQEVVETAHVHCTRRRLLRRGLDFHVALSRKLPIRKKSGNLSYAHRIRRWGKINYNNDNKNMGLLHTNGSPNLDQKTRPYSNQQKKRTCKIVDFAVPTDHRIKLKEGEKNDKYKDLAWKLKKNMEHKGDYYTNRDWCIRYSN